MAYVSSETKEKIASCLKEVMPHDWKYSLSVRDGQMIRLLISKAPVDLLALNKKLPSPADGYAELDVLRLEKAFDGEVLDVLLKAKEALNVANYNNSDSQRDYFDVGYYISICAGTPAMPFRVAA